MSTRIKAVLLDMDGTLFNSEALYKSLWQETAQDFGIALTDSHYQRFIGAHFDKCKQLICQLAQQQSATNFQLEQFLTAMAIREEGCAVPPMKSGAQELLQWLHQQQIPVALVTSSPQVQVERYFEALGGTQQFQAVVTGNHVSNHKPHPEPYLHACQQLGIAPKNTLAVEDSNTGARSALDAGCITLVIPDILPIEDEIKAELCACLDALTELPDWLHWYNR